MYRKSLRISNNAVEKLPLSSDFLYSYDMTETSIISKIHVKNSLLFGNTTTFS